MGKGTGEREGEDAHTQNNANSLSVGGKLGEQGGCAPDEAFNPTTKRKWYQQNFTPSRPTN
jgi:hypothetical protein